MIADAPDPLIPASYDAWWTVMMVCFAAGIVVTLVALIKSYLRMRDRERDERRESERRGDEWPPDPRV
ncbi:hypothetical protein [Demequina sp. NBRC 110053]|uniref:hypothetical protein n=1 Tax=Demequina sp. NBRC 110053 TaxID=1570342 RepID=UPI000A002C58|nr:hypothetical protein [Demequina sp. NBRC 110053]